MTNKEDILTEVLSHYSHWTEDRDQRMNRKNGWNAVIDAYWGKLPDNWPYISRVHDPRIRTVLIEKNARLMNNKLRGRLVPREGGDMLKARLNNSLLDYQWDAANHEGSMLQKWSQMDTDSRMFGSSWALVCWKTIKDKDGKIIFDGNEMLPKDIRNCGIDPNCRGIKDAQWFQISDFLTIDELLNQNETYGYEKYKNIPELKKQLEAGGNLPDTNYQSRVKTLTGTEYKQDDSFPLVEVVTEYRPDRWITFCPKFDILLRDIANPYNHGKIPVIQLRYYPLLDDPIGESEVEPVLPLWRAIQATLCGYLDAMSVDVNPPIKILEGQARLETIVYAPRAKWIMSNPNAVTNVEPSRSAIQYFQTSYPALVSAFNQAMGEISQGVSNIDPMGGQKTATEVRNTQRQQQVRDQKNQIDLGETLSDMMSMWLSNNRQFLFSDKKKDKYILRVVGKQQFEYYKRSGLDEMEVPDEAMSEIAGIISNQGGNMAQADIDQLFEAGKVPKYPVKEGEGYRKKMEVNDMGDGAEISLVPEDIDGLYDYIPDTQSMALGSGEQQLAGTKAAVEMLLNPQNQQMLMQSGVKIKIQDLLVDYLEDLGKSDASKYFDETTNQLPPSPEQGISLPPGTAPVSPDGGMPNSVNPLPPQQGLQPMAGSEGMQI
mgnify:CR=1 FL=1